ncbi:type VII secretion protein EccB [Corynebacterium flavescens]|uniref:type VII secretion protein EccB n=1 Tax=Corynebacterium flavescens TaxID=28028 RepID=UPI0026498792|nr:type VII secretion protein EccB [Corynebacterium flavescens]MDN6098996.1 type VII secretion protein EccB [Corynebacterium flavescens]MDN6431302.1 type VII secretion protein EccB [Corynebacterium flavescens]MDN6474899.1 type VII secretion protein EccB [Corynebacterium flavescens]MDN6823304.1 type VII secretion protein EccB [Corynebacterium flavescens]
MARPLPTTKAQVSGHRFLLRRIEHGLVLGDIRMLHDPLVSRQRALVCALVVVALLALGSGLLAWLQPNPRPGDAPVVESKRGQLFVLVGETYHPVANLSSARIISGEPVSARSIGEEYLTQARLGSPVGIEDAPGFLAAYSPHKQRDWAACFAGAGEEATPSLTTIDSTPVREGEVIVVADAGPESLSLTQGALAEFEGKQWLLSAQGRVAIPEQSSVQGRVLRRALGIAESTFVWHLPPELLNAFAELEPWSFPAHPPEIWDTGAGLWMSNEEGVSRLTEAQAEMLLGTGARRRDVAESDVAKQHDTELAFNLPESPLEMVTGEQGWLCASPGAGAALLLPREGTIELSGEGIADRFGGLSAGGIGVDSGHGYHVVAPTGLRHEVESPETLAMLGTQVAAQVPWEILRLLPAGSQLSRETALRVSY